jgi:hypothetical protein
MAILTKTQIIDLFQDGDIPTGQNFSDWIQTCVTQGESSAQSISGSLSVAVELDAHLVSAQTINADSFTASAFSTTQINVSRASAANLFASSANISQGVATNFTVASANIANQNSTTVAITGSLQATAANVLFNNVTVKGSIVGPSDLRFKRDVQPIEGALEHLMAITPCRYYKNGSKVEEFGFIAQDVLPQFPQLVGGSVAAGYTLNYLGFIALLLAGLQEQEKRLKILEAPCAKS